MKKFLHMLNKSLSISYKIFPFFVGMYCYYPVFVDEAHSFPFLDAVYASIMLYSGSIESGVEVNGLLQLVRFLALATTLNIVINALDKMNDVIIRLKLFNPKATVVYGDSGYVEYIFESIPPGQRIRAGEKMIEGAARYLLMFSEDNKSLEFYNKNYKSLKNKNVYIMLEDISRQNIENPLITVFSITENCARQYWKNYPVTSNEKIAIIGFGNIGKNILFYGLQMNLIDPGQHLTYHIYGDGRDFRREHTELDQMRPDEVIFHDDGVYEFLEMADFDRVIICGSREGSSNVEIASKLLVAAPVSSQIYIYVPNGDIVTNLFGSNRLICFGTT